MTPDEATTWAGFNGTVTRRSSLDGKSHNGRGYIEETTWIEPALDNRWSDLDKLRWWAAVVSHDTGLSVTVQTDNRMRVIRSWDTYQVDIGHISIASIGTFDRTWDYLAGMLAGAQAARFHDQTPHDD